MDRLTHAEVGGPYASREDAQRAIQRGGFDQSPAELLVLEGDAADSADSSREAARTAAWGPYETPTTAPSPSPATPEVPPLGQPVPEQQFPQTSKPAQVPGGAGGLPQNPLDPQFDPAPTAEPGPDPLASTTASVVEEIRAANPGMDGETLIRVASRAVSRLVEADFDPSGMRPHIEDPLHHRNPAKEVMELGRNVWRTMPSGMQERVRGGGQRVHDWAERRFQERSPDLYHGEEEGGQRTLFPEPQHQPAPPSRGPGPEPERAERPMRGQQRLFDNPDEVPDPPEPPQQPARRRRRPPRPRPLPGEFDPPQPPDLGRFDQPTGPQQQRLFD